jgi:hypothetical protein
MGNTKHTFMQEDALVEFLEIGKLGPLTPLISEAEIYRMLGQPSARFLRPSQTLDSNQNMLILYYGKLGITCENDQITSIFIDYRVKKLDVPEKLQSKWIEEIEIIPLDAFREFLKRKHIAYKRAVIPLEFSSNVILVLNSGTEIVFSSTKNAELELISFHTDGPSGRPLEDDL